MEIIDVKSKETDQSAEVIDMIDCGPASEKTQGVSLLLLFELGIPPNDRLFILDIGL
ncbi:hypothetical protein [Pandoraea sp. NPDC087047]|uniref:hypothetical protein n=1 Tax=Pandoraea sp. NPDC087047 TaxID=3364390 RepID=UPI0037F44360